MGDKNKQGDKSRRWFLTGGLFGDEKKEMIKMLTANGKLVEVDKKVFEAAVKQTATNKDILNWMDNPSKENS